MGALKMNWGHTGEEVCGWVGFHHFLLKMIFWQPGNLNYHYKKRTDGDKWRRFMGCRFLVVLF
jgi:hypothetical protein